MRTRRPAAIPWAPGRGEERMAGRLSVRTLGTSGRPFLLVHGLGGSGRYWGAAYDGLTAAGRIVVPDLLGFGRSQRPTTGYTADDHADAIVGCLDELGIVEPAVVGAHSLGCLVALALAVRHPDRVAAIVGAGPPLYADAASARSGISRLGWLERQFASGNRRARRVCGWTCGHPRTAARLARLARPSIPTPILLDGLQHSWSSYSQTLEHLLLAARGDVWLAAVTAPVQLLAGDHDRVPDVAHLRELTRRHPGLQVTVVVDAGHDLPLTHAATVVAALRAVVPAR
ncbi:MAG: alpha/beta hydrolase [Actinomycetota bacterium]|nr:alpha/beta hydrolase [Actinomycetota bacterium]